jgi:hypothetical protein
MNLALVYVHAFAKWIYEHTDQMDLPLNIPHEEAVDGTIVRAIVTTN